MSRIRIVRPAWVFACTCLLLIAAGAHAQEYPQQDSQAPAYADEAAQAPGRVARLAYLSGQVQFAPAGENDWGSVEINRPMVIGDRLLTGDDGRAVLELGDASLRIDHDSAFDFLNLDDNNVQIELSQGTLNVAVRDLADGENMEVDTPTVAFVATAPGVYRIDDSPSGVGSMVTVFRGAGVVYGENGASREVSQGASYRFNDSALASVDTSGLPEPDDFDRFCEARDATFRRYAAAEESYVPPEMIGGEDLYRYGQWNAVPEYGNVWYPRSVPVGWAPYRFGHWAWIDPWGWTWVDDQPWGFAPFHYGRWVYVSNRWGWVPGPANVRPVYAPALVAFIGGSGVSLSIGVGGGGPVGWFPLGPRDVYVPWFPASRRYFTGVNVTNIRNTYINRTVINNFYDDYRHQRYADIHRRNQYRYRNLPGAVTVVPRATFTDARPVRPAVLKLNRAQLARAQVAVRPDVNPRKASLGLRRASARPAVLHGRQPFVRPVVARRAPPPRPVDFATREKVIASQHGQPLTPAQMQALRRSSRADQSRNRAVKLVATRPGRAAPATAGPARPANLPRAGAAKAPGQVARGVPAPASKTAPRPAPRPPVRQPALRPGELPSARFRGAQRAAPPASSEAAQRAPVAGRLPVVRPVQPAPPSAAPQTGRARPATVGARPRPQPLPSRSQPQRQVQSPEQVRVEQQQNAAAQQRARQQQAEQDRQRNAAAQQRARQQQAEQQRAAQAQAQARQREQAQQQARVQAEQRSREQQAQRQRQMQQMRVQQAQQMQRQARQRAAQPPPRTAPPRGGQRPPPPQERQQRSKKKHPPSSSSGDPRFR